MKQWLCTVDWPSDRGLLFTGEGEGCECTLLFSCNSCLRARMFASDCWVMNSNPGFGRGFSCRKPVGQNGVLSCVIPSDNSTLSLGKASTVQGRHPASSFPKEDLQIWIFTENDLLCSSEVTREIEKGFAVCFARLRLSAGVFSTMFGQLRLPLFRQTGLRLHISKEGKLPDAPLAWGFAICTSAMPGGSQDALLPEKDSLRVKARILGIRQACIRQRKTPSGIYIFTLADGTMKANNGCQSYPIAIMEMCKEV
ncbi:hypothetical protein CDL15_Pgr021444 [Punica granatum]|uniref:Uncharacterized protein n=1 Tax=Punica granatum TaxID=22663 RepID=A0A218WMF2_PUNGR|nr:hypothetical protein CDL15_Pgr021444 [Punica granatum]